MDKIYMEEEKTPQIENPGKITLEEFAELIRQMRHNQRRYFAQRRPEILETCKRLEGEVDAIVAKITDKQMRLFWFMPGMYNVPGLLFFFENKKKKFW